MTAPAPHRSAIIDIGSNTVRMVVYGGPPRAPVVLHNEKVTAKLGRDLATTGLLPEKAMASALAALARYKLLLGGLGVDDIQVVATAAPRDAANGAAFLDAVRGLGFEPRLLSGEDEAQAGAWGVLGAFPGARGVVADLGGGSLELIEVAGGACGSGASLPFGTLRLGALRAGGASEFTRTVRKALRGAGFAAPGDIPSEPLYLVGGSLRAFARFAINVLDWPLEDPHGFEIAPDAALPLLTRASGNEKARPGELTGISTSRQASLADAAALLAVLVREMRPSKLVFSAWGLREGLLFRRLGEVARAQDPLLAGVAAFASPMGGTPTVAALASAWTAAASIQSGAGGERLRLAATMLALASMRVEPNLRARNALDWALHKRWIGLRAAERAMIAAALLANTGRAALPPELARLATPAQLAEAQAWGLAIRLCRRLGGCTSPALSGTGLTVTGDRLVLEVDASLRALVTDMVEKDLQALADRLAVRGEIAVREVDGSGRSRRIA